MQIIFNVKISRSTVPVCSINQLLMSSSRLLSPQAIQPGAHVLSAHSPPAHIEGAKSQEYSVRKDDLLIGTYVLTDDDLYC